MATILESVSFRSFKGVPRADGKGTSTPSFHSGRNRAAELPTRRTVKHVPNTMKVIEAKGPGLPVEKKVSLFRRVVNKLGGGK